MTREALLKQSIKEFEDKKQNALFYVCKRVDTPSGYVYLVKGKPKKISCAIHYNRSFEATDNFGRIEVNDVAINTREELGIGHIVEYKDFVFGIASQEDYNATMGQWHYQGVASHRFIQAQFYVENESLINKHIGYNAMAILHELDLGFHILPPLFAVDTQEKFIMMDVEQSTNLTPVYKREALFRQERIDDCKLSFVNLDTNEVLKTLYKFQQASLVKDARFGFLSLPSLSDNGLFQKSFNWRSLAQTGSFRIHYALNSDIDENDKMIRQATLKTLNYLVGD